MKSFDYLVIGGGIVGFSTAWHLAKGFPAARVLLVEKEDGAAAHQTGRNSGVIHSGIYYKPGSYKARFAKAGSRSMVAFCEQHGIPHRVCGKIIVACDEEEAGRLDALRHRGIDNGVPVERLAPEQVREIEPHVRCVAALRVESTGITSYRAVCAKFRELIEASGGETRFGERVLAISEHSGRRIIETTADTYEARIVVNCAGLHSDRIARMTGTTPPARIVPFRGEYFKLVESRRHLVNTLVYPVPNPAFPFLGVHFTRMIDGSVHAGPNAVLAFKREGYRKSDINLRDLGETLAYPGFWKLAAANLGEGLAELRRSILKSAFVRSLQRLVPDIRADDLVPCQAGVRAQALFDNGHLADDFLMMRGPGVLHVCNAPSPAATAAIEIGKSIVRQLS